MQSLYSFIIQPKNGRYTNEVEVGDKKLIVNTTMDDHKFVNRVGVVMSVPLIGDTDLSVGDEVIVHHNVFRRWYDIRGKEKNSKSWLKKGTYIVYEDQIFAYKRNNKWNALKEYCFVKPIKSYDKYSQQREQPLIGVIKYIDNNCNNIKKEDLIGFTPHSEYEFIIDGERLYRVLTNSITIKYEYQGKEEEYNPSWLQSC